jgi:hypothetical protein
LVAQEGSLMSEDNDQTRYPNVEIKLRFVDANDDPVEGLRVELRSVDGFHGEESTDSDGEVEFTVRSWRTYSVYVEHSRFDEVGVSGGDKTFDFTWD